MKTILAAAALLGLFGLASGHSAADPRPRYTVVPLQLPAGAEAEDTAYSEPHSLNNKGECVGLAGANGRFQAIRWDAQGECHVLGKPSDKLSDAWGINDGGQAIAYASLPGPSTSMAARLFLVDAQGSHLVTPPAGTETMGFDGGEAINNAGQVAFNTQTRGSLPFRAFLSDHGKLTDLGHLPLRSFEARTCQVRVRALNNSGMAAGVSQISLKTADGLPLLPGHAFLWQHGVMNDLGVPPGYDDSSATALNDRGDVIGTMDREAETQPDSVPYAQDHGFLWRKGVMSDLGTLPGCRYTEPTGINGQGQIVGNSYNIEKDADGSYSQASGSPNGSIAFLWQDGKMQDLQTLVPAGWQLYTAVAINDQGDILCTGSYHGTSSRTPDTGAFLLRPR